MVMWLREHDPFVSIYPVSSTSFLPLIYSPPELPPTIHIAIYLPTAGRESEFVAAISCLDDCVNALLVKHPDATLFLRGDFNVSKSNPTRTGLLNFFAQNQNLIQVDILHPTYHHFLGNGSSDSHLDRIMYSKHLSPSEQLKETHCKLTDPLGESHHDVLVSVALLPHQPQTEDEWHGKTINPKMEKKRPKVKWSEAGIEDYSKIVTPLLQQIQ